MKRTAIYLLLSLAIISGCSKSTTEPEITASELLSQGWTYFNAGSFSAALTSFQQAKAKDPSLADAYNGSGWCQGILGYRDEALATFKSGLSLQTSNLEMRAGISFVYASFDSCQTAIGNDSLVLIANSSWVFSHKYLLSADGTINYRELNLLLAECYYKLGNFTAALEAVKKLDPAFDIDDVLVSDGQKELLSKIESLASAI